MTHADHLRITAEGARVMHAEAHAIHAVAARIHHEFVAAVQLLQRARLVHVSGVGKSGAIARKIAGTLTSTGTPATFLHPTEALHGDLGLVSDGDVCILISRSGECEETLRLAAALLDHPIVAITGVRSSRLALMATVVLDCAVREDACPLGMVPTCSTAASLAMGDALAVVLMGERGFGAEDFRATHPGGVLGRAG